VQARKRATDAPRRTATDATRATRLGLLLRLAATFPATPPRGWSRRAAAVRDAQLLKERST
jgi:hypothetical protein